MQLLQSLEPAQPAIIHRWAGPATAGQSHLLQGICTGVGAGFARRPGISCFLIGRSVAFQATASGVINELDQDHDYDYDYDYEEDYEQD
jgi:hypothetical protein